MMSDDSICTLEGSFLLNLTWSEIRELKIQKCPSISISDPRYFWHFHPITNKICKNKDCYSNYENTSLLFFLDCLMTFHGLKYPQKCKNYRVKLVQINIYQSNTYKRLKLAIFWRWPRVQERQQVKDQQSCLSVFVAYPIIPSSN